MLHCPNPTCKKPLRELTRTCPFCQADLDLLVGYVDDLRSALSRAEALTRAGELGQAVWAYLAVLDVDPDNAAARRQVGQVATAVRQFDRRASKRWRRRLRDYFPAEDKGRLTGWFAVVGVLLLILAALLLGYQWGAGSALP